MSPTMAEKAVACETKKNYVLNVEFFEDKVMHFDWEVGKRESILRFRGVTATKLLDFLAWLGRVRVWVMLFSVPLRVLKPTRFFVIALFCFKILAGGTVRPVQCT